VTNSKEPSPNENTLETSKSSSPSSMTNKTVLPPSGSKQPENAETKPFRNNKSRSVMHKPKLLWPIYLLFFVTLFISTAAGIYFWQQLTLQKIKITQLQSDNSRNNEKITQINRSVSSQMNTLGNKTDITHKQITALEKQTLYNTQKLNEFGASSRSDWLLSEAEYLLHLANQRLNLEHDINGTEAILVTTDKVLAENNDPSLMPVRQALASEILSLQQIAILDRNGIYVRLAAITTSLDALDQSAFFGITASSTSLEKQPSQKLAEPNNSAPTDNANFLITLWQKMWFDLKKVFVIKRLDMQVEPLLAPEQSYYLKQNLRLMLEQANLALLDQNTAIFQNSLSKASKWLIQYFNTSTPEIEAILTQVNSLKNLKIEQQTPDISKSLRLLKTKIESMYRNHQLGRLSTPDVENQEKLIKALEKQLQEQTK